MITRTFILIRIYAIMENDHGLLIQLSSLVQRAETSRNTAGGFSVAIRTCRYTIWAPCNSCYISKIYFFPVTLHFLLRFFVVVFFQECFSHIVENRKADPDKTVFIIDVMFITMSIFLCSLYRVKEKERHGAVSSKGIS